MFVSSTAVHIYDYHTFKVMFSPLGGLILNQNNDQPPVGLLAQLVRALHQYCRGHGFKSHWGLNLFLGLIFTTS